jgi:hypothetical protein
MHHGAVRSYALIRILIHPGRCTTFGKIASPEYRAPSAADPDIAPPAGVDIYAIRLALALHFLLFTAARLRAVNGLLAPAPGGLLAGL